MGQQRAGRYLLFGILAVTSVLVISGWALSSERPSNAQREREALHDVSQTTQGDTKQAGAYFFYWWLLPDDPDGVDPYTWMAFHPPALVQQDTCFHDPVPGPCIEYTGGSYNSVYYNVDSQRWWEWQFRDMAEAGLDIAFMNSWDVVSMANVSDRYSGWTNDQKTITYVRDALVSALDTIGNPIKIALFDDTRAEHYQWCLDNGYPMPDCDGNLQQYPMSLIGSTMDEPNKDYFWYKWRYFYEAIPQDKWATHNGLSVDQGGRPLILMWHGWFFIDFAASSETMCYLKEQFYNWTQQVYGQGVEPFLLPDSRWREPADSDLTLDSMCPAPHSDWHAIDGWSYFGMATSGEGAKVFPNDRNSYTTAYLGPGADHCAYSGPYGPVNNPAECSQTGLFHRWWDVGGIDDPFFIPGQEKQDNYYESSWLTVPASANLVVVESWNELSEGTSVSRLETYIAPDLTACLPDFNDDFLHCPFYKAFTEGPHGPSGGAWTDRYWMRLTRYLVEDWKGTAPPTPVIVDNNNVDCADQGDFYGNWTVSTLQPYRWCPDAAWTFINQFDPVSWTPWSLTPGTYDVYAWWQEDAGGSHDAGFQINGSIPSTILVDQSRFQDAGYWNYVGRFPFAPGNSVSLASTASTGEAVLADAVAWLYRSSYTPPPTPTPTLPPLTSQNYLPILERHSAPMPTPGGVLLPTPGGESYPPPPYPPLPTAFMGRFLK